MARQNSKNNIMYSPRKVSGRSKEKTFLIVCEGKETEPNYFQGFQEIAHTKRIAFIKIKEGVGVGITVVKTAKQLKEQGNYADDEVWCVFDRDFKKENNNQQNFNSAIKLAIKSKLNLAVSNDAFELWFLLHYEYYQSQTHRSDYEKMLSIRLSKKYEKNSETMYEKLNEKQSNAIKFAKKLWSSHCNAQGVNDPNNLTIAEQIKVHNINPSTTVYKLVEKLNQFIFTTEEKIDVADFIYAVDVLVILIIAQLLNNQYFRFLDFYFHTLIKQLQKAEMNFENLVNPGNPDSNNML